MDFPALRPVLERAADVATDLGHHYLGPEHLLIAASATASPARAAVLARQGLHAGVLRADTNAFLGPMLGATAPGARPEPTLRARRALEHAEATRQARTSDDLLLALLADDVALGSVIGAVLARRGLSPAALRADLAAADEAI